MTRMPESRLLILNRVWRTAVAVPASAPAANAASVAAKGFTCATISTAATEPPSVIDPSVVMSGNSKIRKLMKTPNASRARIRPIVSAPMSSSMSGPLAPRRRGDRSQPAGAAHELALAGAGRRAIVVQEVQHAQRRVGLEEGRDRLAQIDPSFLDRAERKRRGVQVTEASRAERPQIPHLRASRDGGHAVGGHDAGRERHAARERRLGGEGQARAQTGMREEVAVFRTRGRRAPQRGADEAER